MKIIEKKDHSGWKLAFTCSRCESRLEAESSDLVGTHHDGSSDPRESHPAYWTYSVQCPVCQQTQNVREDSIPKGLQYQAQTKFGHFGR